MDGFEFNKIAGAVLAAALGVMGLGVITDYIYEPIEAEEPGYVIAVATSGEDGDAADVVEIEPIANRLQVADVAGGQGDAKKCLACHTFEMGGAKKVGPNLWDIVGRPLASVDGFGYSDAFTQASADGMTWTFEDLDLFLEAPKKYISGTAMAFAGIRKPEDRADLIAYLRSLSDSPVPLPTVAALEEAEDDMEADHGDAMEEETMGEDDAMESDTMDSTGDEADMDDDGEAMDETMSEPEAAPEADDTSSDSTEN